MKPKPTVSVQIVTYNSAEDIDSCLNAVFNQSYPIHKIIVIDNNSHDYTVSKISNYKNVQLIKNKENIGFAAAHNQGINLTNTDYVLVLNPDVQLQNSYIDNIIEILENSPNMGMATGKLYRDIDKKLLDSTGIQMKKNRRAIDRGTGEIDYGQFDKEKAIFGVSGAAAIYKRAMINDISFKKQFFDESFFAYKEDVDVSWRGQLFGWGALFVPSALAIHTRGWKEDKKRSEIPIYIRQKSYINRYFYILKNDHLVDYLKYFPYILLFEVTSLGYTLLKERKLLSAWLFLKKEFKNIMKKREFIMSNKKNTNKHIYSFFKGIW